MICVIIMISTRVHSIFHVFLLRCSSDIECDACQYEAQGLGNCLLIILEQDAETFMAEEPIHIYKEGETAHHILIDNRPGKI